MNIAIITACPSGVANSILAAGLLEQAAAKLGWNAKIECQSSVIAPTPLTDADIEQADAIVIAANTTVDTSRFVGKKVYQAEISSVAKDATAFLTTAVESAATLEQATTVEAPVESASATKKIVAITACPTGVAHTFMAAEASYKHLMTGVSHMLPVVVAGGLIIALSFVFGIEAFKGEGTLAAALMTIGGGSAFALMIPVLAGYIAFSIADRPGLAPGLVGGMLASSTGAGFLGGIAAGFIAGYAAKLLADKVKLPQSMEALKPILIIPFVATLFTGLVMIYIVGGPVSGIMNGLTDFLNNMGSDSAVLLGIILGAMMCFDLGGPVNKAAYAFGVGLLASQTYAPMAAIMAAGMVPALGMGLATFLAKNKFEPNEREAGKASFVLGLCFISEGAIPFAAKDPMRVIPSCMAGGALTGALSMLFGAKLMTPHGGLFVLLIPNAISPVLMYLVAIAAGTAVTGFTYAFLKNKADAKQEVAA
ncbi:fructose-specific PTS transporter subunit EIIC [Vibrio parahaemolyticus]